jgi:hypothetical protein
MMHGLGIIFILIVIVAKPDSESSINVRKCSEDGRLEESRVGTLGLYYLIFVPYSLRPGLS